MNKFTTFICVLALAGASPVYAAHHYSHYSSHYSRHYSGHHYRHYPRHNSHRGSAAALGFLGGFVVGSVINRPAPPPRRVVRYVAPRYVASPMEQAFRSQSGFIRRQLQVRLQEMGFYYSYIDGAWGPGTQGAFESFAASSGRTHMLTSYAGTNRLIRMLLRS
jgi:hypothetical protein